MSALNYNSTLNLKLKKIVYLFLFLIIVLQNCENSDYQINSHEKKIKVRLLNSLERLKKSDDFNSNNYISLDAVRNEWVSFQLAIKPKDFNIPKATIEVTSFYNNSFNKIDSTLFKIYLEQFIEIKKNSPESKMGTGWFPDPLIPFKDPISGKDLEGKYDANPYNIKNNENTIYYIECKIPGNCPSGIYSGSVIIKSDNNPKIVSKVQINVRDYSLPDKFVIESSLGGASSFFKEFYADTFDYAAFQFEELLIDHHFIPTSFYSVIPKIDNRNGICDFSQVHGRMSYLFDSLKISVFPIPLHSDWPFKSSIYKNRYKTANFIKSYENYFQEHNWNVVSYIYLIDEPDIEDFYKVRDVQNFLTENDLKSKQLTTLHVRPVEKNWGGLKENVGIWCPSFRVYPDLIKDNVLNPDDLLWTYTALCRREGEKVTPFLQIDFPLLNYRVLFWIMAKFKIRGFLYWSTNYWNYSNDPWQNSITYFDGEYEYNGEGNLTYPSVDAGYIGLCPSLRLKTMRDGAEDFFILMHADSINIISGEINKVAKNWNLWDKDLKNLQNTINLLYLHLENIKKY